MFDINQFNYIPECRDALGVESGAISDRQMSASSQWDENLTASQGRLNVKANPGKGHTFLVHFFDVSARERLRRETLNATFYGGRKRTTTKFLSRFETG